MPALPYPRVTQSGACPICGAYGQSPHRPNCRPRTGPRLRLGRMRGARRDARKSAAIAAKLRADNAQVRDL
jgi:hypothetical protein